MQQPSGILQVAGEMVSIVLLALTGASSASLRTHLNQDTQLTVGRAFGYIADTVWMFTRVEHVALLLGVLVAAALIRIAITYANRSVLLVLKEQAGIDASGLSWEQRAMRLPVAVVYRALARRMPLTISSDDRALEWEFSSHLRSLGATMGQISLPQAANLSHGCLMPDSTRAPARSLTDI